jgi:hypothetical protein
MTSADRFVQRGRPIVRSLWAACLLIGGLNHARILLRHGLSWDYGGIGWPSAAYWTSLTILDPIAAALLFLRPKVGIVSAILLIATNVIHNLAISARYAPEENLLTLATANPFIISQIGFLLFVGATARIAWKGVDSEREGGAPPTLDIRPASRQRRRRI